MVSCVATCRKSCVNLRVIQYSRVSLSLKASSFDDVTLFCSRLLVELRVTNYSTFCFITQLHMLFLAQASQNV